MPEQYKILSRIWPFLRCEAILDNISLNDMAKLQPYAFLYNTRKYKYESLAIFYLKLITIFKIVVNVGLKPIRS